MLNQLHLLDNQKGIARLADKSVNLIIADPPYYKIKGDFDFEFKDFQEYLNFMEDQAKLYKRVLADNGSLFVYGNAENIAYVQIIFDKYFKLENSLVWENTNPHKQQIRFSPSIRSFAPLTERILFYSNEVERTGLEMVDDLYIRHINPFSVEIKKGMEKYKLKESDFRKLRPSKNGNYTGWCSNIILGQSNPTKEDWELINTLIKSNREYEDLRREYEDLRRPFNNKYNYGDVIRIPNFETNNYDHDTIKPERLTLDLIETTTRENDIVLIPFGGSGTECVCAMRLKRQWIAFENKKKYFDIAMNRISSEYEKTSLFNSLGGRQLQLSA